MSLTKQEIRVKTWPPPTGPYSQAIRAGDFVFVSGQTSVDITSGRPIETDLYKQSETGFKNIIALAESAGGTSNSVVKTSVFVTNLVQQTPHVNSAIEKLFDKPYPSRTTVSINSVANVGNITVDAVLYIPHK